MKKFEVEIKRNSKLKRDPEIVEKRSMWLCSTFVNDHQKFPAFSVLKGYQLLHTPVL